MYSVHTYTISFPNTHRNIILTVNDISKMEENRLKTVMQPIPNMWNIINIPQSLDKFHLNCGQMARFEAVVGD
jgi:hypothetical protein